jgi:hypothetical protein
MRILDRMRRTEKLYPKSQVEYARARAGIIGRVRDLAKTYRQHELTVALACELTDRYFLNSSVENANLMSATALMVASKFDEIDYNLVKVRELSAHFPSQNANDFVLAEKKLLQFFDWDIKLSTPLHFINNY